MIDGADRFVGSIPEHYDAGLGPHIFADYADDLARRVAAGRPKAVLELAAGTGILTRRLRDVLPPETDLIASDLNAPMLEVARTKFRPDETVRFQQVDATKVDFESGSFDAVACQFGVMFFPDKEASYSEVFRVLRSGGGYLFSVWDSWSKNAFARITHEAVATFFPGDPPGFYRVPFNYCDPGPIRKSVEAAGFTEVTIDPVPVTSAIPSAARFATGLVFGNPVHDEIVARGGDPRKVCDAVTRAIDEQLGSGMTLQALIVHARKR